MGEVWPGKIRKSTDKGRREDPYELSGSFTCGGEGKGSSEKEPRGESEEKKYRKRKGMNEE